MRRPLHGGRGYVPNRPHAHSTLQTPYNPAVHATAPFMRTVRNVSPRHSTELAHTSGFLCSVSVKNWRDIWVNDSAS
ncbi:hypothetical protein GCM10020221_19810 [Streptomyces thioluteus]|uniref:Uncharacterized protein n=1 Tax=Streptomyces thioluteus TaxID=66431 RepID=A0ABN3WR01_STRTU